MGQYGLCRQNTQGKWEGFMLYIKVLLACAVLHCGAADILSEMGGKWGMLWYSLSWATWKRQRSEGISTTSRNSSLLWLREVFSHVDICCEGNSTRQALPEILRQCWCQQPNVNSRQATHSIGSRDEFVINIIPDGTSDCSKYMTGWRIQHKAGEISKRISTLDFVRLEFIAFQELLVSTHFAAAVEEKRLLRRNVL